MTTANDAAAMEPCIAPVALGRFLIIKVHGRSMYSMKWTTTKSYCDGFINLAIGRVEVRKTDGVCTVNAHLLTGDRLSKPYVVSCKVDERNDMITDASCQECEDIDGCKHSLLLLHWLQTRSSEPPPESNRCFWDKPVLSPAFTQPATVQDMFPTAKRFKMAPRDPTVLQKFFQECERRGLKEEDSLILKYKPKSYNS